MVERNNRQTTFISHTILEGIARKALKDYNPALLTGEPCAIPIEKIAESHFGLSIEYHCLRKNGLILGETVFDDTPVPVYDRETKRYDFVLIEGGTIILDESLLHCKADGRLRFTCAHELAHWLIHRELYLGSGETAALINSKKSSEDSSVIERQADILGTALLMPAGQVKRAFYRNMNTSRKNEPAAALAELFDVSKQAMGIFLKSHNLV